MNTNWLPISEYDKLDKKPEHCVFWFKEINRERKYLSLKAEISGSRFMGNRQCTHFKIVGKPC